MELADKFLIFHLGHWKLALNLDKVVRTLPIIEVIPLPDSPSPIVGLIRLDDELVPVANLRELFGLPSRPVEGTDVLVIASTATRQIALWADAAAGIESVPPERRLSSEHLGEEQHHISGVVPLGDDILLIYDLEALLSKREEAQLTNLLEHFQKGNQE